ncbi:uncharacterized protein LOC121787860 [Salvia splendens]|uniref:uncharacterized protein LOC121787860 n=1 Tax=Salvia splendens TaxID=180675 RepID=UPI001C260537|nr:uncharacterized protein LOC121787860 [Salvia splendens]
MGMHGRVHDFPGMSGSIDCMQWEWKNCPAVWRGLFTSGYKGTHTTMIFEAIVDHRLWIWHAHFGVEGSNNDINVLNTSSLFVEQCNDNGPVIQFTANGRQHYMGYYLADDIYPRMTSFLEDDLLPNGCEERAFCSAAREFPYPPSSVRRQTRSSTVDTPQLSFKPALRVTIRKDTVVPKPEFPTSDDPSLLEGSNDDDDGEEVESAPSVHGHRVKAKFAPLVGAIFNKYGDITANSNIKSPSIMASFFLERLCDMYQRLEKKTFQDFTRAEINGMLDNLQHQAQKFNVEWLLEKVKQISEVRRSSTERYLALKGEATKYIEANERMEKEIQQNQRHIALIQKKISTIEKAMEANEADADNYTKMAVDVKVKVKALASQSLVHGLL